MSNHLRVVVRIRQKLAREGSCYYPWMTMPEALTPGPKNDDLIVLAYDELRRIAHATRQGGKGFNTTTLVHETYLKLREHSGVHSLEHLKSLAARAMRQILVDHARRISAAKRGGAAALLADITLEGIELPQEVNQFDMLAMDQALHHVEKIDPRLARVVDMYVFAGMSMPEIADTLSLTERTVFRDWRKARALLTDILDLANSQ